MIEQAVDRYWKATENSEIPEGPFFKIDAAVELMSHLGGYEIALWQECPGRCRLWCADCIGRIYFL